LDILKQIRKARRVYIIGNGGSYATAEHVTGDLLSVGIRAFSPNVAFVTATGNDQDYSKVFSRWIKTVGEKGDLLIALSGSGTSENIVRAIKTAKRKGMDTALVSWFLKDGIDMEMSEEAHLNLGHYWKKELSGRR
jgi:D-sedoheptulose 7-phosphate isomerase